MITTIAEKIIKKIADAREVNEAREYFNQDKMVLENAVTFESEEKEPYVYKVGADDLKLIAKHAKELMDEELQDYNKEAAYKSALELAIKDFSNGKYDGKIDALNFNKILNIMDSNFKSGGKEMKRTARYYTSRLDKVADEVRKLVKAGELAPKQGMSLELAIDQVSDELEKRYASRLSGDADETYMDEHYNDGTRQRDADEDYLDNSHPSGYANDGQNSMSEEFPEGDEHKLGDPENKSARLKASKLAKRRR